MGILGCCVVFAGIIFIILIVFAIVRSFIALDKKEQTNED
jgi:hypothetical protein